MRMSNPTKGRKPFVACPHCANEIEGLKENLRDYDRKYIALEKKYNALKLSEDMRRYHALRKVKKQEEAA